MDVRVRVNWDALWWNTHHTLLQPHFSTALTGVVATLPPHLSTAVVAPQAAGLGEVLEANQKSGGVQAVLRTQPRYMWFWRSVPTIF